MFNSYPGAGTLPTPVHGLAMLASQRNFNQRVSQALGGAFGGNMVPGPISHLVNRMGDGFVGAGYGSIAQTLPNYVPNADGHGIYFGPGFNPAQNQYFGGYKGQSYVNPFDLTMGHHSDPGFPGGVRGGHAEMDLAAIQAIRMARQITQQTGRPPQIIILA